MLQAIRDQYAVSSFLEKTVIPVPETIAYDATVGNQIESEYTIQRRIPGVPLEDVYHGLDINEKEHILGQVIDLLAKMEGIQFQTTGQLVAAGSLPDALVVDGSNTSYNTGLATAPFPAGYINPPKTGPPPTTLEEAFADRLRFWIWSAGRDSGKRHFHSFRRLSLR